MSAWLVVAWLAVQSTPAPDAPPTQTPESLRSWGEPPNLTEMVGRTALATGIVLALAVLTIVALRFVVRPLPAAASTDSELLSLRARMRLGPRAWLLLVRAGENDLLVALDQSGIQHLTVLPVPFSEQPWQDTTMADGSATPGMLEGDRRR